MSAVKIKNANLRGDRGNGRLKRPAIYGVDAKLVFVDWTTEVLEGDCDFDIRSNHMVHIGNKFLKPLLISEEQPSLGDYVYNESGVGAKNQYFVLDSHNSVSNAMLYKWKKVLAKPENFSFDHFRDMELERLKDQDIMQLEVLGVCANDGRIGCISILCDYDTDKWKGYDGYVVKLNSRNQITIFPLQEIMVPLSIVKKAFDDARKKIPHPDWDYVYEDFEDWMKTQTT